MFSTQQNHVRCEVCGGHCNCADHNQLQPEILKCEGRMKISFYPRRLSTLCQSLVCADSEFNIALPLFSTLSDRQGRSALLLYCLMQCLLCTLYSPSQVPAKILTKQIICCSCQARGGAGRGGAGWLRTRAGCKDDNWLTFWLHLVSTAQLSSARHWFYSSRKL